MLIINSEKPTKTIKLLYYLVDFEQVLSCGVLFGIFNPK